MTGIDLDTLEALASAATEGPWEVGDGWVFTDPVYPDDNRLSNVLGMKYMDESRSAEENERGRRNAEFIAAAREAVPALVARVRELEAQRAEARPRVS